MTDLVTMPHLILEYSSNVVESEGFDRLFAALHEGLADVAGFNIHDCKSRGR